ncbi:Glutamyl-tRNA(Gln) amidotransferase subunit A [Hordeum vulgare]|nr:Glutamyl-tRNA(Gln) amidotransferase subunit A [Hordeum vulgare]
MTVKTIVGGQRHLLFAKEDERAMAEWHRRHPEDVAAENIFWVERTARRREERDDRVNTRHWPYRSARSSTTVGRRSSGVMMNVGVIFGSIPQTLRMMMRRRTTTRSRFQ